MMDSGHHELDGKDIRSALMSEEDSNVKRALLRLRNVKDMKKDVTDVVIPQCLELMQHKNAAIKAGAIVVIKQQMCLNNSAVNSYLPEFAQNLSKIYSQPCDCSESETNANLLRHLICRSVTQLHLSHAESLLPHLPDTLQFMVGCTGHEDSTVKTSACEYWRVLSLHAVHQGLQDAWCTALQPHLKQLIQYLAELKDSPEFALYPVELKEFLQTFQLPSPGEYKTNQE